MIVLNGGVPRSGTVLVNAILRRIFEAAGVPTRQANPHGPELPALLGRLREAGPERHGTVLVHTHSWDAEAARLLGAMRHAVFLNYRDPRDVCVSLMRLHDHPFDAAAEMTLAAFRNLAAAARDTDAMIVPYEHLVAARPAMIFQIARRLGAWPGLDAVMRIDEATSLPRHRAVMEQVRDGAREGLTRRRNTHRVLVEDPRTLINDRHIQSGAHGRWRTELTEEEQAEAAARFAPLLARYGYGD